MTQLSTATVDYHDAGPTMPVTRPVPAYEPPLDGAPDALGTHEVGEVGVTSSRPNPPDGDASPVSGAQVLAFPASRMREPPPEPSRWAAAMIVATLETLHGARTPGQLRRWLSPPVHAAVAARAACITRSTATPPRILIRSIHATEVDTGRVEAAAVVEVAGRCRAIALQMRTYDGRWRVTALEIG